MYIASQGEEIKAPETLREAMQSSDMEKWKEAMKCEMDNLREHIFFVLFLVLLERKWSSENGCFV